MISSSGKTERESLVTATPKEEEIRGVENALRPTAFADYIGQTQVKHNLQVSITASKKRQEPIEHILLQGPPGLGKTTLAHIIAKEMGVQIRVTSGPAIEKQGDLASLLTNLEENDILFIDEIHRLKMPVEEILYSAMEDYAIDIIMGKGPGARSMRLSLPRFTLIGATTKINMLSSPLRDRFGNIMRLEFYTEEEIAEIIRRSAALLDMPITEDALVEIAKRSRRTPRIANRLLKRVRDFAHVEHKDTIDFALSEYALSHLGIDASGLDHTDRTILRTIIEKFSGGPVGLNTLAAATSEEQATIEDVYEPYLIQLGFLDRTPRGRMVTRHAYQHFGLPFPEEPTQENLFV
jgi:Holliday junction DNA helicase RuvB